MKLVYGVIPTNIFNRRELYLTRSQSDLTRVLGCLTANNLQYRTKTNTITNSGRSHGIPFINADHAYEYRVYVYKADWEKAQYVISV